MRTAQPGDRVQVHYVKRWQDGSVTSSRGRAPLQLTVGVDHPRLPGLGSALVGLVPGAGVSLRVPPERAHGWADASRVHRWSRKRFPQHATLVKGKWLRFTDERGRRRLVRILEVTDTVVVVDTNHRRAGQALELEVELLAILDSDAAIEVGGPGQEVPTCPAPSRPDSGLPTAGGVAGEALLPSQGEAVAFDVDAVSLASLRQALPGWRVQEIHGATAASLPGDWNPGAADLLVLAFRGQGTEGVELCRFLAARTSASGDARTEAAGPPSPPADRRDHARRADAPLLGLVPPGQEALVRAVLEAGAHSCLVLPVHAKEVASMLVHARAGNQPGRHTLNLEQAQSEDRWRDDGGQG
jgi:peptidylprolyl isomerase